MSTHTIEGQPTIAMTMEERDFEHYLATVHGAPYLLNVWKADGSKKAKFSIRLESVNDALATGRALCLSGGCRHFVVLDMAHGAECVAQDWVD